MPVKFTTHPQDPYILGNFLIDSLNDPKWTVFRAAVAFIKRSGTKHIVRPLSDFVDRGGIVSITAGVDVGGTTVEGLTDLFRSVSDRGDIFVFHNANSSTFHPKIYLFKNATEANIFIGSANLTEGGLYTNYEAGCYLSLDLADSIDTDLLMQVESTLDEWSTAQEGVCFKISEELIDQLVLERQLPNEAFARAQRRIANATETFEAVTSMFIGRSVPSAPRVIIPDSELGPPSLDDEAILDDNEEAETLSVQMPPIVAPQTGEHQIFLMTLQKTDVGVGQTTTGKQRRSPEIFIPLICRDYDPEFWGWPDLFVADRSWTGSLDQHGRGKMDRTNVMVRLAGEIFPVSIWYNPDKRDVRLRSEHIRSAGAIGDILYLERADGTSGFAYYVEIIPQRTVRHAEYLSMCTLVVRNSRKHWNYL